MPNYIWKGVNSYGQKRKGKMDAPNEATVHAYLKRLRITPSIVKEAPKDIFESLSFLQPGVTGKDVVIFTRQLSTMIDAGLPLIQAVDILANQQDNPTFKKLLTAVKASVETGTTFADALKEHPKVFDTLYCNMVEAGEMGGILDVILNRLAVFMEKNMKLVKKVKGAFTYPVICLGISGIVMVVMLLFVVPVFEKMFADFGSALPAPTQIVVNMSEFMQSSWYIIFVVLFFIIFTIKQINKSDKGEYAIDALLLKAPIFGTLLRRVAVAKFTRTLGTMVQSGVPILDSLDVVAKTAGNRIIEEAVLRVVDAITEGRTIADPLEETGVFPNMVVQMISVGEATGALDAMLEKIADFYDDEVDQAVDNLTAAIEPLMMMVLGTMIGGLVIAMYLPIFAIAGAV
jgi:type IV pilus assembly protein PilC